MALLKLVIAAVVGVAAGFGVPLLWIWVGSMLQGETGASSLDFTVVMVIVAGMVVSYMAIMYVAGWVIARRGAASGEARRGRNPAKAWSAGSHETRRGRERDPGAVGVEEVFVYTTVIVAFLFWLWFLFLAGSPLPNQ